MKYYCNIDVCIMSAFKKPIKVLNENPEVCYKLVITTNSSCVSLRFTSNRFVFVI